MTELVEFKAEHLERVFEDGGDPPLRPFFSKESAKRIEDTGFAFTVMVDSYPVVVGGIYTIWNERGEAWMIFSPKLPTSHFITVFRLTQRALSVSPLRRIEMTITKGFEQGHRWAKLLGFKLEGEFLRKYMPDGRDVSLYAKVRES